MRDLKADIKTVFQHNGFLIFSLNRENPKDMAKFLWQTREYLITTKSWSKEEEILINSLCGEYPQLNKEFLSHGLYSKKITDESVRLDILLSRV